MKMVVMVLLTMMVIGCSGPKKDSVTDVRAEIERANAQWMSALKEADLEKFAVMYTEDTKLLPPNTEMLEGREAVRKVFGGMMDAGIHVQLHTEDVQAVGDVAVEVGRAKVIGPDDNVLDSGKYLVTWRKTATGWKMQRDIWNSSLPVTTPAES